MAKNSTKYTCSKCSATQVTWSGQCNSCKDWNTLEETSAGPAKSVTIMGFERGGAQRSSARLTATSLSAQSAPPPRVATGHPEFDRVLGGGLVEGSAVMIGGSPGIGKSTLLLQVAASLSRTGSVHYFSGEETEDQIQLRARRLGLEKADVQLYATNDCLAIADHIETLPAGSVAIVDSLQTLYSGGESAAGSISQVKAATGHLIPASKTRKVTLILVSHVTKEGSFAGPNTVVHAVDAAFFIEADMSSGIYRIIRAEKNRFGAADEAGIFEMTSRGMQDVENPSSVFIAQRDVTAFGTVIYPSLEGSRPVLLETQALVSASAFGTGRRSSTGWDTNRLNMILATLSARFGISFADKDVYVNIAGGMKVSDPAMDMAVAAAILSADAQKALPSNLAVFGEIGLAGEVRNTLRSEARIKEAVRLGYDRIICPVNKEGLRLSPKVKVSEIRRAAEVFDCLPDLQSLLAA